VRDQFLRFLTSVRRRLTPAIAGLLSALKALDRRAFRTAHRVINLDKTGDDRPVDASSVRAESRREVAIGAFHTAMSAAGGSREALMQMSRARKAVLLGVVLFAVGVTGRASAEPAPDATGLLTAFPAVSKPAPAKTAKPKPDPPKKPAARTVSNPRFGGPAGSHMLTGNKGVALTFDDGPDPAETPKLLKLLAKHHVRATFCLVGSNAKRHPELVRQIVAGGHTLCNHTWNHSLKLGKDPAAKIRSDLERTNAAILQAAPDAKIKYFRAPGGNFTPRLVDTATELGMTSIYWKVDPRDWEHRKGENSSTHQARVISQIERHCRPGAIVLSHDYAQPDTIAAYRKLIPWLKKRYTLVALP